jgi:peptidoglycan L-alanyl-D-glutamate endopeptidase CwlK
VTNAEYRVLFFQKLTQLIARALSGGIRLMPYWIERSAEQQFTLYQQGRTEPGKVVTNCDGYKKISPHQRWRAADLVIVGEDGGLIWDASARYELLGQMWKDLGGKHGGDFKGLCDMNHFEL